jgi:hypothetical protein
VATLIAVPRPPTTPDGSLDGVTPCPLKLLTGLDCPLCGATRATLSLFSGDLAAAIDHNVLYVLSLPLVAIAGLLWVVFRRPVSILDRPAVRWALVGVAVAFAVVRNLPMEPFTFLGSGAGRQ